MSRLSIVVVALVVLASSVLAACGSSDEGAATETPVATVAPAESAAAEAAPAGTWTTLTTLTSTDPANEIGVLVSGEFTASGDVRVVLDVAGGDELSGVVGTIIPAGAEVSVDAATEGESVTVAAAAPKQVIRGLDGTYVLVVSVSTGEQWSLAIQTKQ
jgi:hypothetical protein